MFVMARAATYATLFIGLLLVLVPRWVLERSGIVSPTRIGAVESVGVITASAGAALVVWCIVAFAAYGRGTPAPFDPPRRMVVRGPYRYVRNPMYLGATLLIGGVALFYRSVWLLAYAVSFLTAAHAFVVGYEERALARRFGAGYEAYRARVGRWRMRRPRDASPAP